LRLMLARSSKRLLKRRWRLKRANSARELRFGL
jgi:hypothetical protein